MNTRAECFLCAFLFLEPMDMHACIARTFLLLAYLFLCFILGPGSLAILLAQGLLLLVVQQRVVFMVTCDLVLIVLQHLSQEGILQQRR